jgi:hypothetical protein
LKTVPLKTVPLKTVPLKTVPLKMLPLKTLPLKTLPLKTLSLTTLPSKTLPLTTLRTCRGPRAQIRPHAPGAVTAIARRRPPSARTQCRRWPAGIDSSSMGSEAPSQD